MKQFRLYLGRTQGDKLIPIHHVESFIREVIVPTFDAFTVIEASGRWKDKGEPSTVIEIIADAVLVTSQDVSFDLIGARLQSEVALA